MNISELIKKATAVPQVPGPGLIKPAPNPEDITTASLFILESLFIEDSSEEPRI